MVRKLLMVGLLAAMALGAMAQVRDAFGGVLPVTDPAMKKCLNGEWHLKVVEGIIDDAAVPTVDATWGKIPVPGCWEVYGFSKPSYDRALPLTGYYRTTFDLPEEWRGMRICIRFDGVLYGYDLWVNGRQAGEWRSAYNSAVFDITDFIRWKADRQELAMKVVSQFRGSDFDYNDDWAPCGIFRDVTLMAVPDIHLSDLAIRTDNSGVVNVKTVVAHADKATAVQHEIFDALGNRVGDLKVEQPRLWTAETPYLYTLRTTLTRKGKVLQTFEHKFGFREVSVEGNLLKINGKAVKLRGVTCHATDPKTGKVIGEQLTLKDMRLMKEASVNYIRTSHYPREPRFYELADSLGFYIIDEVPFGFGDKNLSDSSFYPVLQQRAQATIRRDKNHPSVIIWSLGNENPLTDICVKLGDYVKRQLDDSRPVCYPQVGSYFRKFNYQFPQVADIYAPHYPTTSQIAGFYQKADRPVIFTEYCHTLGISFEDHDRQWEIIERTPCIAGGSVWEWVDQGMPFRERLDDRYGYEERVFTSKEGGFEMYGVKGTDGLLFADRTPLPNYYELQHNYAQAFVADSVINADGVALPLKVVNRYDFLDLKDHVAFHWAFSEDRDTIAQGAFSPDCLPRQTVAYQLVLPRKPDSRKVCLLGIKVVDAQGRVILRQSIPVNPTDLTDRLLAGLKEKGNDPMGLVQGGFLVREGRKPTMAEQLKVKDKRVERYLVKPDADGMAGHVASVIKREDDGWAVKCSFSLTPDTTDTFLSELGVAMLLDSKIDRVQWIGNGWLSSYPGRFRANRYGFWAMHKDDLYFEGNRRGVDAALFTDSIGNGLLLLCRQNDVSFEQTDRGVVVTCNAAVSGQGPKFTATAFPVVAKRTGKLEGSFYLYRVEAGRWPALVKQLFGDARMVPAPFRPFEKMYDTYLMRFDEIVAQ